MKLKELTDYQLRQIKECGIILILIGSVGIGMGVGHFLMGTETNIISWIAWILISLGIVGHRLRKFDTFLKPIKESNEA